MRLPGTRDVADLLRLPSVLSVPGDVLLGAAVSSSSCGRRKRPLRVAGPSGASSCLFLSGMALNDYADSREPGAHNLRRRVVGTGVPGLMPLEEGMVAASERWQGRSSSLAAGALPGGLQAGGR